MSSTSSESAQKPLTILIAADTYPPHINGAAQFCLRLATGMTARGHDVHVMACREDGGPMFTQKRPEATVHRLRSRPVPTHEYFRVCLPWEIKRDIKALFDVIKPDVVHVQSHYMIGEHVVYEAARRGIRIVATNHFMPENLNPFLPFPQWFKNIVGRVSWRDMGKVMSQADVVTTPTPLAAKAMHEHAFLRKVLPLSNGIESGNYELAEGETAPRNPYPTLAFVGRLAEEKHIDVLIDAVAKTPAELDLHLVVVGGGEVKNALKAQVEKLGLSSRVTFTGLISDEELREIYLKADLFVMPGTAELQSLVTLEAMSASTPVILANAMALPHLVDEGVNGYLFIPNDSDDLAAKITKVMSLPPQERAAMGEASHAMVARHGLSKTLDTFEDIYRGGSYEDHAV
ncbi:MULTISPECIES: glycosyltransferase [Arthrobacter]|uniref:D-inositol 3-phosphate glycosyltransferase n=1 Tax=Arthrobacter psychrochitiniphilus TaxID=291045 RepID=A0A2V3DUZ7_9MICC|nr:MULTISPECIES: glycosyltransferase [Arthrobacter]NYG16773.1 glycosyltransferase involved in cell wall biosynthesis [Arthrobacter psychrochitiniphilus]PXA69131.1 glycosyltransferase family 4 protein [Arthrobacter psychrochitiniphilus]